MIDVILLTSAGCHLCEDARETLEWFGAEHPITVREIDIASDQGRRLVARYRPATPPAVIVDGELLSAGRLSRGRLRRYVEGRVA